MNEILTDWSVYVLQTYSCRPVGITLHLGENQIARFPVPSHAGCAIKQKTETQLTINQSIDIDYSGMLQHMQRRRARVRWLPLPPNHHPHPSPQLIQTWQPYLTSLQHSCFAHNDLLYSNRCRWRSTVTKRRVYDQETRCKRRLINTQTC